ncbi:hypothetical protein SAMN06296010_2894 [Agreia pratensis]|uniref:Uncharacterized protein n=1 Tax=Agreia pratensis TaxID=150121 RepID=A0A1X7KSK6_9MICO|nr:hypothetical protein SAMN06296010_2894 [Agreia pratensis]
MGALVNTLLLATTLWLAIVRQPRIDRSRAEEIEASRVIAWPAETYLPTELEQQDDPGQISDDEPAYHGVVLANTSKSTVRNVDIKLTIRHPSTATEKTSGPDFSTILGNRELILPPGSWFVPIQADENGGPYEWKLPIPVDTDGKLQVSMQGNQTYDLRTQQLRQNEREVSAAGEAFGIGFLRFTLDTQTWWRDSAGYLRPFSHVEKRSWRARLALRLGRSLAPGFPDQLDQWEGEFRASEVKKRVVAVESNGAAREGNKMIADRIYKHYRDRNAWAERNQGTGVFVRKNLAGGPTIRLAGSGLRFPDSLTVMNGDVYDKVLSRRVFDAVLKALPSPNYTKQRHLREKTAEFWQEENNFSDLIKGIDAGLDALELEFRSSRED